MDSITVEVSKNVDIAFFYNGSLIIFSFKRYNSFHTVKITRIDFYVKLLITSLISIINLFF